MTINKASHPGGVWVKSDFKIWKEVIQKWRGWATCFKNVAAPATGTLYVFCSQIYQENFSKYSLNNKTRSKICPNTGFLWPVLSRLWTKWRKPVIWHILRSECFPLFSYQVIGFLAIFRTYNWVYPRLDPDPKKDKTVHWLRHFHIDLPWLVNYFKNVISSANIDNSASGMLLNLGLHFIRSTSFANYRTLIDKYIDVIKQHKTNVIWRTTTSIHKPETKAHKRFQTHQVVL